MVTLLILSVQVALQVFIYKAALDYDTYSFSVHYSL